MAHIFTGLNAKGRNSLVQFLRANLKDHSLLDRIEHFENDISFDDENGHLELGSQFTQSGAPVTTMFCSDEMVATEVDF